MGVNINSSFLLSNANSKFHIPVYESNFIESYYLPSLSIINEMNDSIRSAHLELYKLSDIEFLDEGTLMQDFMSKINDIITTIIKTIKKIKDVMISNINKMLAKARSVNLNPENLKETEKYINSYYDKELFIKLNIFSNTLKDELINANIPSPDYIFSDKDYEGILNTVNDTMNNNYHMTDDQIKDYLETYKNRLTKERIDRRQQFIGVKSIDSDDLIDFVSYKEQLQNNYIGAKTETVVTRDIAIKSIENLLNYKNVIADLNNVKSTIEKRYSALSRRIEIFRKDLLESIKNPTAKFSASDKDGATVDELREKQLHVVMIAKQAIVMSNTINAILQDHLTAYMVKLECLYKMNDQDVYIMNSVVNAVKKSLGVKMESADLFIERMQTEDEMNDALTRFCEGCFVLRELQSEQQLRSYVYGQILTEAEDGDKKNVVERIVNMIVEMFKKFMLSLNKLVGTDKKWLEQNATTIKSSDFKFPAQDQNMEKWIPFREDLLSKPFNVPAFDMNNSQLMDTLVSDEEFAKFIYSKIGASEADIKDEDAKNGSFAVKCKAIFSGGKEQDVKISSLQTDKDKFFEYCNNYLQGENGGIYKSIVSDTKALDQSKKNVERALKSYKPAQADNTSSNNSTSSTQASTNGTSETNDNNSEQNSTETKNESFGFGFDIAGAFGLMENANILIEAQAPNVAKTDAENLKGSIGAAGGNNDEGLTNLKEKSGRFFTMLGNALGAKMTVSMQCYNQYMYLFKWALKSQTDRAAENADTTKAPEKQSDTNSESIIDQAKK